MNLWAELAIIKLDGREGGVCREPKLLTVKDENESNRVSGMTNRTPPSSLSDESFSFERLEVIGCSRLADLLTC